MLIVLIQILHVVGGWAVREHLILLTTQVNAVLLSNWIVFIVKWLIRSLFIMLFIFLLLLHFLILLVSVPCKWRIIHIFLQLLCNILIVEGRQQIFRWGDPLRLRTETYRLCIVVQVDHHMRRSIFLFFELLLISGLDHLGSFRAAALINLAGAARISCWFLAGRTRLVAVQRVDPRKVVPLVNSVAAAHRGRHNHRINNMDQRALQWTINITRVVRRVSWIWIHLTFLAWYCLIGHLARHLLRRLNVWHF